MSGSFRPKASAASCALLAAMRAESMRLIWPAPMPTVADPWHRRWRWTSRAWRRGRRRRDRCARHRLARAWSRPSASMSSTTALSRDCTSKPPATELTSMPCARGSGRPPVSSRRRFFLAPTMAIASSSASGAMMTSVKISVIGARGFGVELAVQRHDAAEGRDRVAGQRLAIGVEQRDALRHAAGIGVLDDGAGGGALRIELGDAFIGRVGVVDVVVGELLALHLPRGGDTCAHIRRAIECRRLVRVLAIAQRLGQPAAEARGSPAPSSASCCANQLEIAAS